LDQISHDSTTNPHGPLPSRVLYVQHAGCLGGSATSLRYLAEGMQAAGVDCTIALARPCPELFDWYAAAGIPTIAAPEICCWDHSTVAPRNLTNPRHLLNLASVAARWRSSQRATLQLVDRIRPDLVHLNSMPLSSSASALTEAGMPFVWHVREPPPDQGLRTRTIRGIMNRSPQCVFITRYDKQQWVGNGAGRVVYNCVPDDWFERPSESPESVRADGVVRFAYLGGFSEAKGVRVLLEALRLLKQTMSGWECVMPGCLEDARYASRPRLSKRVAQAVGYRNLRDTLLPQFQSLAPVVQLQPFAADVRSLLRTVDFVVFPATRPHFPRPVIEAAALGKPTVGTDVGGVNECVVHGETGLLCRPDDAVALADTLREMIASPGLRQSLGARAYERAVGTYSLSAQRRAVAEVYRDALSRRSAVEQRATAGPTIA
jgi:glycosyltransferase involved in cell wall biosynthesis